MSDSLLKANRIVIMNDDKRVIDSNQMISDRIRVLTEILENQASEEYAGDFADGFSEGLDAIYVDQLLQDQPDSSELGRESIESAQAEAQRIIDEANERAAGIINDANSQASDIIQGARADADQIMQSAQAEGHQQGYNAGYEEGMAGIRQMEDELAMREQMMQEEYSRKIDELEPQFVDLLTDIYSHVLGISLSGDKKVVAYLIKDAIRNIDGGKNFFVHVSRDDYAYVASMKDELASGLGSSTTIEIIEDMTLGASECFVEAESGIFDCSLGTELELLKKELILLSYKKEN